MTPMVENSFYRVTVDPESGAVKSIYDKQLQRDIVDSGSPYRFGQYLYVTGGDGDTQMVNPFPALPPGQLTVHPSSHGKVLGVETPSLGTVDPLVQLKREYSVDRNGNSSVHRSEEDRVSLSHPQGLHERQGGRLHLRSPLPRRIQSSTLPPNRIGSTQPAIS